MEILKDLPVLLCESAPDLEQWLDQNASQSEGVWLKIAKKSSGKPSVSYFEAVDLALCYGWIDSQILAYDASYYVQKFTPRRSKSIWSKVNVQKVALLTEAGRMKPAGIAAVEAAKQDGRLDRAYDSHRTSTVPSDFQAALDQNPQAKEFFVTLTKTNRYAILWQIQTAVKPETRQARIEKFIEMLNNKETIH